jgi:methyl-accepting chemotaxis protein
MESAERGEAEQGEVPSARAVIRRTRLEALVLGLAAGVVTLLSIHALSRRVSTAEGSALVVLFGLLHFALALALHGGFFRDLLALDQARRLAVPDRETIERGLARVASAPRFWCVRGFLWFAVTGIDIALLRHVLAPDALPWIQVGIRSVGAIAGAFVYSALLFFLLKRRFAPLLAEIARDFGESERVRRLIRPVPLRLKLLTGVIGTLLVAALYGALLAHVRAERTLEVTALELGGRVLDALADGRSSDVEAARRLGLFEGLALVDPAADPALTPLAEVLSQYEIDFLRAQPLVAGDSRDLDSERYFAWRTLADGRLALTITPAERFARHVPSMWGAMTLFFGLVLLMAAAVAWLLAADTKSAVFLLSEEVARLSSGDLRRGRPLLWEDELGELAGSLDHMAESLGSMIVRVRGTADRVDGAASGIAAVSTDLLDSSDEQRVGAQTLRASLLGVTGQVEGISVTARELTVSVEEGSGAIVGLRNVDQQLDQNAILLSEKVDDVSSAIDQLIRSARDVLEQVEHLTGAAVDTSSSMEQMAASLREVDNNATETARLSQDMVARAEDGREKVRETLRGMESIRDTTETARSVIRGLGSRTKEIGAILTVIDDVAEETNLLALNAAIIAAQAGENGRAFSVVAQEIKKLADRVLTSTKEIERVIRSVQDEASNAVTAIERGASVVETGVRQADEAGAALDAITESARGSGARVGEIVTAVNEQTRAAGHVVALMERVRAGVEHIRRAGQEQDRGNESILATTEVMREIARRVRASASEQAQGSLRLSDGVEAVREAVERIAAALSEQSVACGAADAEVRELDGRTSAHGKLAEALGTAVEAMRGDAERLRDAVERFRV